MKSLLEIIAANEQIGIEEVCYSIWKRKHEKVHLRDAFYLFIQSYISDELKEQCNDCPTHIQ